MAPLINPETVATPTDFQFTEPVKTYCVTAELAALIAAPIIPPTNASPSVTEVFPLVSSLDTGLFPQ